MSGDQKQEESLDFWEFMPLFIKEGPKFKDKSLRVTSLKVNTVSYYFIPWSKYFSCIGERMG
jgi:hypothetical protein